MISVRGYPGLVNCTTIDWFLDWPVDALTEVCVDRSGLTLLGGERNLEDPRHKTAVATVFGNSHAAVVNNAKMRANLKRYNYVTPTSFLELVKGYRELLGVKRDQLLDAAKKLEHGVGKLVGAKEQVEWGSF